MASIGNKRDLTVSDPEESKSVSGVPLGLSPVKKSRSNSSVSYFDGKLSDGQQCVRVISFETDHLDCMKRAQNSKSAVLLSNCAGLEVVLSNRSTVLASPKQFSVEGVGCKKAVKIADILDIAVNESVDVSIVRKGDGKELKKQEVVIGDETGSCRMVLWEEDVNELHNGTSYCLSDVGVREYGSRKYIGYTSRSLKEVVGDVENVKDDNVPGFDDREELVEL